METGDVADAEPRYTKKRKRKGWKIGRQSCSRWRRYQPPDPILVGDQPQKEEVPDKEPAALGHESKESVLTVIIMEEEDSDYEIAPKD